MVSLIEELQEHVDSMIDILAGHHGDDLFIIEELSQQLKDELDNFTND